MAKQRRVRLKDRRLAIVLWENDNGMLRVRVVSKQGRGDQFDVNPGHVQDISDEEWSEILKGSHRRAHVKKNNQWQGHCPSCGAPPGSYQKGVECPNCGYFEVSENFSFKKWIKNNYE